MERHKETPSSETSFTRHCCDNTLKFFGTDNNYLPSFQFFTADPQQSNFQFFSMVLGYALPSEIVFRSLNTNFSPPGVLLSTQVDLSDICVFRI
jgi:hypothetical protein